MNLYRSELTPHFLTLYRKLPVDVRARARHAYQVWRENPDLPGLRFKRLATAAPLYSVRIDSQYRAVGLLRSDLIRWDFIGNHDAYIGYLTGR